MIKLIIFDAGDLLWVRTEKNLERGMNDFFRKHKINGKIVNSRWKRIKKKVEVGKIRYDKATDIQFKGLGAGEEVLKEWFDFHIGEKMFRWKLRPYVRPTLSRLEKRYKLAILTDDYKGKEHKLMLCKRLGICLFDEIFSSHDIGFKKPQRGAYFTVLKHFKVKPNEAVFVGHSRDELEGARKFRIKTIAIDWDKGTKSDFYIKRFSEIPKVLEKIEK